MKLFLLCQDNGDGSSSIVYCIDPLVIDKLQELYDDDKMDYENGYGVDGDGFHYDTLLFEDGTSMNGVPFPLTMEDVLERFE